MHIERLKWDSSFFQKEIGKIEISRKEDLSLEEVKAFDLVYVFSQNDDLGFKLMDRKVLYVINDLKKEPFSTIDIEFYDNKNDNYQELLDLTLQSGEYSRFKLDSNFTHNEYVKLYTEWINGSIDKRLATDIIVKRLDGKIVGFSTLSKKEDDMADIGLVAVSRNYRGKGIAKELILNAINLAKIQGYKELQVATQFDNVPANELYKKCGFSQFSLTYIYHIWNHDTI